MKWSSSSEGSNTFKPMSRIYAISLFPIFTLVCFVSCRLKTALQSIIVSVVNEPYTWKVNKSTSGRLCFLSGSASFFTVSACASLWSLRGDCIGIAHRSRWWNTECICICAEHAWEINCKVAVVVIKVVCRPIIVLDVVPRRELLVLKQVQNRDDGCFLRCLVLSVSYFLN